MSTVTQIGLESAMSPSPKSRKISGGIGLPPIVSALRASLRSDAVDGVSPAEAGRDASDTAISAPTAQKRKTSRRIFENIEQNHFGQKARNGAPSRQKQADACYGERLVCVVLTSDIGDVAPAVLPVRINDSDFREKIQARA
jgi:hypothetical protein